jgi:hypothetical protein
MPVYSPAAHSALIASSVMVEAETKEEATDKAYREYWDIEDIVMIKQA